VPPRRTDRARDERPGEQGNRAAGATGATGTVTFADVKGTYGNLVIIDHGNGIQTYYAHQLKFKVTAGNMVNSGDAIGEVGSTGSSTGNHLHFEVNINGTSQNPLEYLNAR
jgi:murein DD-endopeptidase MepM/ murein hydrolase activator NlpD